VGKNLPRPQIKLGEEGGKAADGPGDEENERNEKIFKWRKDHRKVGSFKAVRSDKARNEDLIRRVSQREKNKQRIYGREKLRTPSPCTTPLAKSLGP